LPKIEEDGKSWLRRPKLYKVVVQPYKKYSYLIVEENGIQYSTLILYRVIHKPVKPFKNSQQIAYATDHGKSYADRERNSPSFF
jgi:hypothetical protein